MRSLIKANLSFFIPYALFLVASVILLLTFSKSEIHITANCWHNYSFDFFFKYFTWLGDGLTAAVLIVILLFISYRKFFVLLSSTITSSLIVFVIKRYVINPNPRPLKYFEGLCELYLVPGVGMRNWLSFPSGHTTVGFVLFLFVALSVRNVWVKTLCFLCALFVGLSRVYLSQHFFVDIVAGSFIGSFVLLLFWVYFSRFSQTWLDGSLIKKQNR